MMPESYICQNKQEVIANIEEGSGWRTGVAM